MIALWVASALAGAAWGFASLAQAPPAESTKATQHDQTKQPPAGEGANAVNRQIADYTYGVMWFTAVLAPSTIGLWIVTGYGVLRQRRDTRITQRAYLWVAPLGVQPFGMDGKAHISVKNVGEIPARDVSWFINHILSNNGVLDSLPIDESRFFGHKLVIHPGAEMNRTHRFNLGHNEAQAFKGSGGRLFFFVYGVVRYLDGFGKPRYTKFCHRYDSDGLETIPLGKPFAGHSELTAKSMRYHQFGNDAD